MSIKEESRRGLYIVHYVPDGAAKGIVVMAHGILSSHKEIGSSLPTRLSREGFHVVLFDFHGHGQSEGPRGLILSQTLWEDFHVAMAAGINAVPSKGIPVFGLGHSLGTAAVLRHAPRLSGMILAAPPTTLTAELNFVEKVVYAILFYGVTVPFHFAGALLGSHAEIRVPYKFDKYSLFSDRFYADRADIELQTSVPGRIYPLLQQVDNIRAAKQTNVPALVLAAKLDRVTGEAKARTIYNALASADKSLCLMERSGHSMFQDQEGHRVAEEIMAWLNRHV